MSAGVQLSMTLPKGYVVEPQPAPPIPVEPVVIVTTEVLQAAARHWEAEHCFRLSAWLYELADAAKLDLVPIRLTPELAAALEIRP